MKMHTIDSMSAVRRKGAQNGSSSSPTPIAFRQRRGQNKYSRGTLNKLLLSMLTGVFVVYVVAVIAFTRHHSNSLRHTQPKNAFDSTLSGSSPKENVGTQPIYQPLPLRPHHTILRAYLEPIDQSQWDVKPLPVRKTLAAHLTKVEYPGLTSCANLMEQWPVDDFPDDDPFLPWIHDVFPTADGKFIQFVAQNRRRCHTGHSDEEVAILKHNKPQIALFQHVPLTRQRVNNETRYRLCPHEQADQDGMSTRFICRFKPSMQETLAKHNVDYDFGAWRKGQKTTFTEDGHKDIKSIHTSQLLFQCPVPENLQQVVRLGTSVEDDWATLFLDLVPVRTPPRFGSPSQFFPPRYKEFEDVAGAFNAQKEWGENHVLPRIEDSGRWENIPICKPSQQQYEAQAIKEKDEKSHRLVACLWASSGYYTRGERFAVTDGLRRLKEWLNFNLLTGVEHFYIYDNSDAHGAGSLKEVTDLFPEQVTRVVWPSKVCNNRQNNVDSPGERSSQYAAESSCRLRFGPHADWIAQFDIDEYLVPMGQYTSLHQILDELENEGKKIISFASWRSWPRRELIEEPEVITDKQVCGRNKACFKLKVPTNRTILQTYNCDRQKGPKKEKMPAEKQIYKADYVKMHFIHYSTITELSMMNSTEFAATGRTWQRRIGADPLSRFGDEINEATMLHAKSIATQDTAGWQEACIGGPGMCRIGNPYPDDAELKNLTKDEKGWEYNCYVNERIDSYWVPRLEKADMSHTSDPT